MLGCRTRPNQALDFFVGQFDPGTPGSLCEGFLVMEGRPKMFLFYREMFFFFSENIFCVSIRSRSRRASLHTALGCFQHEMYFASAFVSQPVWGRS
jgi:hypothetical protein